jgi:hypothetical protein
MALPDFKICSQILVIVTACIGIKEDGIMGHNREPRSKLSMDRQLILHKGHRNTHWAKGSLQYIVVGRWNWYM